MATTKIDLGNIINQGVNTIFAFLNKRIGGAANPLYDQNTTSSVKIGNVGGLFGINLNWGTLALIGAGIVGAVLIVKKIK